MTAKRNSAPEPQMPLPKTGGSFIREADGSLHKVQSTTQPTSEVPKADDKGADQ